MQRKLVKREKLYKIRKRLTNHSAYEQLPKSIVKRFKCLNRYQKQIIWSGLVATGISMPMNEVHAQCHLLIQGSEFRVNTFTTSNQGAPSIASDAIGNFAVVWHSFSQPGGNSFDIYGQRYLNDGIPDGIEFRINSFTTARQVNPVVAMDAFGNFVVAWEREEVEYGTNEDIAAQRFNSMGVPVGGEFIVNTQTNNQQLHPSLAMNGGGNFIIAWTDLSGEDGSGNGVFAQRFNEMGIAQGSQFQVNSHTTGNQIRPSIAMNDDGKFIIAWTEQSGVDGNGNGVFAQRYDEMGMAQGGEFQVNTETASSQAFPTTGMDKDGNMIIVWQSNGQDGSGYGIFAQRFDDIGMAIGPEFQVNTITEGNQIRPKVSMNESGDFVISWHSMGDGSGYGIFARRYDSNGVAEDASEFLVNTFTTMNQQNPSLVMDLMANFIITWESYNQDMGGGSIDYGVYAQRFSSFCTGMELVDPCNCDNEDNIVDNGNIISFHEILQMNGTGTPGADVILTANNNAGGFTNAMGTDYAMGEILGTVGMDGTYSIQFEFYRIPGQMVDIEVDGNSFMADACSLDDCIAITSIGLNDPCDCDNPDNIVENDEIIRFHDILNVTGTGAPGDDVILTGNNNPGGFTDASGTDYSMGEVLGQVGMDGNINIAFEFYRAPGEEVDIVVEGVMFMSAACDLNDCTDITSILINDPCDCDNPENIIENEEIIRYHETLIIAGSGISGQEIRLTANNNAGGFTDVMGTPYPGDGSIVLGMVGMDGTINISFEFYRAPGEEVDIEAEGVMFMSAACSLSNCDDPVSIPTLSQWGTVILSLAFSILAIIGIRQKKPTLIHES